jgi:hypothetical protein
MTRTIVLTEVADLTLEDGTGVVDANTYNALATISTYVTARQYGAFAAWLQADETNRVTAAIIAASYIDQRWGPFKGFILEDGDGDPALAQGLLFPKAFEVLDSRGIEISETVPQQISDAHAEYAARAIDPVTCEAIELQPDITRQDASGRTINRKREKLGPLEEETYYDSGRSRTKWTDYGTADQIIRQSGLLAGGGDSLVKS